MNHVYNMLHLLIYDFQENFTKLSGIVCLYDGGS